MDYTKRKHAKAALDSIQGTAERMTSGNFMHNKANISLVCSQLRELLSHATFDDEYPLISVKDRLPEIGQKVIVRVEHIVRGGGEEEISEQFLQETFNGRFVCDNCRQERSSGVLYDLISHTTHWMPTPELPKGGKQ